MVKAIDHALRNGICWIAAPAGYGKTTAMLDYLQKKPTAHLWYRVDEGDQDVASFFHHIGNLLPARGASELPVFGPEYADQPAEFARRFFRAFFRKLSRTGLLVIDDLHYGSRRRSSARCSRSCCESCRTICNARASAARCRPTSSPNSRSKDS